VFRRIVGLTLADLELAVVEGESAAEALALIEAEPPTLVLCDVEMPGGSGLDVVEAVRARWPELAFVLWSAAPIQPTVAKRACELGVRGREKVVGGELLALVQSFLP